MRRVGLFGGTFDPPHAGHLMIAEWARESLRLDTVLFIPSGTPPHKHAQRVSPARDRLAMTRLAVRGNRAFAVSAIETDREGASYTIDTLRALGESMPRSRFFLVIGEDSLREFSTWREWREIRERATLVVAPRAASPGARAARARRRERGVVWLESPALEVSSRAIRARARAGKSIRYLVPDVVHAYLSKHRLYGGAR